VYRLGGGVVWSWLIDSSVASASALSWSPSAALFDPAAVSPPPLPTNPLPSLFPPSSPPLPFLLWLYLPGLGTLAACVLMHV
jgi:hypothetical protein